MSYTCIARSGIMKKSYCIRDNSTGAIKVFEADQVRQAVRKGAGVTNLKVNAIGHITLKDTDQLRVSDFIMFSLYKYCIKLPNEKAGLTKEITVIDGRLHFTFKNTWVIAHVTPNDDGSAYLLRYELSPESREAIELMGYGELNNAILHTDADYATKTATSTEGLKLIRPYTKDKFAFKAYTAYIGLNLTQEKCSHIKAHTIISFETALKSSIITNKNDEMSCEAIGLELSNYLEASLRNIKFMFTTGRPFSSATK